MRDVDRRLVGLPAGHLCLPQGSEYTFTWSATGAIAGQACVRWYDHTQTSATSLTHFMCVAGPGTDAPPPGDTVNGESPPSADPTPAAEPTAAASDASGCSTAPPASHGRGAGVALALAALVSTMLLTRGRRTVRRL